MHDWSDETVDWDGINAAAQYLGVGLRTYFRIAVADWKEKFGTVRVYCHFGWNSFYSVWRPSHHWIPKWYPYYLDLLISRPILWVINPLVRRVQIWGYVLMYKNAVEKWPHLRDEILSAADWGELFEGKIPGYRHSDYWVQVDPYEGRP